MTSRRNQPSGRRPALSLLEVLVAMAIFLFSMVVLGRLVIMGSDLALEARFESEAAHICQSKLNEVTWGAIALSSQGDVPLDEDPDWHWSLDAEQGSVSSLWNVTVKASHVKADGSQTEYCSLSAMVLDPSQRGSTQDTTTINGAGSGGSSGSGSSSGTSNPSSSQQATPSTPGPASSGGARPSTGGASPAPASSAPKAPFGKGGS